jgi:MOSC domain-containing protein YiiM
MAHVSAIYMKKDKDSPREEINSGEFRENHGLVGDINSAEGPRQVCLLRKEDRELVEADTRNGLCFKRFLETVQTEGIPTEMLAKDNWLRIGDAILKVSSCGKKCWPECEIIKSKSTCALSKSARFLSVLESGTIKKGDVITQL